MTVEDWAAKRPFESARFQNFFVHVVNFGARMSSTLGCFCQRVARLCNKSRCNVSSGVFWCRDFARTWAVDLCLREASARNRNLFCCNLVTRASLMQYPTTSDSKISLQFRKLNHCEFFSSGVVANGFLTLCGVCDPCPRIALFLCSARHGDRLVEW